MDHFGLLDEKSQIHVLSEYTTWYTYHQQGEKRISKNKYDMRVYTCHNGSQMILL